MPVSSKWVGVFMSNFLPVSLTLRQLHIWLDNLHNYFKIFWLLSEPGWCEKMLSDEFGQQNTYFKALLYTLKFRNIWDVTCICHEHAQIFLWFKFSHEVLIRWETPTDWFLQLISALCQCVSAQSKLSLDLVTINNTWFSNLSFWESQLLQLMCFVVFLSSWAHSDSLHDFC